MQDRRSFLGQMGFAAAALLVAEKIAADPARAGDAETAAFSPIRLRGRVRAGRRGISGVGVSDGLSVTRTDRDGRFELISSNRRRFVHVSLPAGYRIPVNDTGTARLYHPIRTGGNGEMSVEFALEPAPDAGGRHGFLLMADPQTLDEIDIARLNHESVQDIQSFLKSHGSVPYFGVACGDILYDRLKFFPDYERAVRRMGIPCFQVPGNHDVEIDAGTDELSVRTFERHFGPTYYSFNRGEIHYVVLDDVFWFGGYVGYVDRDQLDWLRADLALVEEGRTVVVFTHIPVYSLHHERNGHKEPLHTIVVANRELLYRLLEPFRTYIITGHLHETEFLRDGGADIHVCGALCGAWWSDSICYDGTPNGYMVYHVKGNELTWRYKSTGKREDHQMRLYAPGTDPAAPRELIANVWGADRGWDIVWYEGGMRKGALKRRLRTDPLAVRLYEGSDLPRKYPWVDPVVTDHIFTAKPDPTVRDVVVEAVDRWGKVYSERMEW